MNTRIKVLVVIGAGIALLCGYLYGVGYQPFGSAPSGLPTTIATTSQFTVTTSAQRLFATSTCDSRVITTTSGAVMLSFSDVQGFVPTAVLGHLQLASTTVTYDSGQWGCNTVRVISATAAASTITASESR